MVSDNVPVIAPANGGSSGWIDFIKGLGLHDAIAKSAIGAIHRLIRGAVDYPAALLDSAAQGVRDEQDAKSRITSALADAAIATIPKDPDLGARALAAWLPETVRKQQNREAVAQEAIKSLNDIDGAEHRPSEAELDPDWMNAFLRFAEDASSERMRELWGRVLAREVVSRGSFSIRAIRFMAELDADTASAFERISRHVFDHDGIDLPEKLEHELFADVFLLEQAGLVSYGAGRLAKFVTIGPDGRAGLEVQGNLLAIEGVPGHELTVRCGLLTKIGREIMGIVPSSDPLETARSLAGRIPKGNLSMLGYVRKDDGKLEMIWNVSDDA